MMSYLTATFVVVYLSLLPVSPVNAYHDTHYGTHAFDDEVDYDDKKKFITLSKELVYHMQLMQRQLLPFKLRHVNSIAYQIGLVIGTMREKYKRMMEIYAQRRRQYTQRNLVLPPGEQSYLMPIHVLMSLETVRVIEMEIHKYIDLLLTISETELDERSRNKKKTSKKKSRKGLRMGNLEEIRNGSFYAIEEGQNVLTEEDIKRQYREEYMRKNGIKKENWSLDQLYGFV